MDTILIVDSDPINLTICKTLLSNNWQIATAKSGLQALGYLNGNPMPGLILLALEMPGMGGLEVLRQIRARVGGSEVAVMMLAAAMDLTVLEEGYSLGAADFLQKPIIPPMLLKRVTGCLEYIRLCRENVWLRQRLAQIEWEQA